MQNAHADSPMNALDIRESNKLLISSEPDGVKERVRIYKKNVSVCVMRQRARLLLERTFHFTGENVS